MNIVIDIRTLMDERYSGVSEYTYNLTNEILKLDKENKFRLFFSSLREERGLMLTLRGLMRTGVEVVWWRWPNKVLNYLFFKPLNWPKVDERLGADIYWQPHLNFVGLSTPPFKRGIEGVSLGRQNLPNPPLKGGRIKILTIHDLSFLRYPEFFSCRKNFWHRMMDVKKLAQKFDLIVAISENTKRDVIELLGVSEERVMVIYSGIGNEFKKYEVRSQKLEEVRLKYKLPDNFILFLGTLEPRKNIEGLIEAYNLLREKSPQPPLLKGVKLVIAGGKGWKSEKIFKAWERSSYKDDIIFTGYVDRDDKPYLYNLASLFVYPSFYEGFGFPPLEAMACGVPVIASNVSSLPEVVGDAALIVNPYNTDEIASAMKNILENKDMKKDLVAKGLLRAKLFTWEKTAGKYRKLFFDFLNAKKD